MEPREQDGGLDADKVICIYIKNIFRSVKKKYLTLLTLCSMILKVRNVEGIICVCKGRMEATWNEFLNRLSYMIFMVNC